ncbi:alkaline phosphatase [Bacillus thuringiensis]|uniref:DedA family protein n=1 Tax=Bacillus thuringiensis TaxID=1428 RepID=UPI000BEC7881|nr:DedA family protein [Bacillus thuringiensis]PDY98462.1 alkaline phosphatase [Bacillus thuringiensis]PGV55745.1 alkaline phosphatase [Bacillus thuringiensis]QGV10621.1 DedA family protein [Bacillus cereus]
MEQQIGELLIQYGYFGILIALVGGIVGLPIPDEFLLTFVGYNVSKGTMSGVFAFLSGMAGAILGITLSYILGLKLGLPILNRYGSKIYIKENQIEKTHALFEKYGPFFLIIGYFIPGVRHLTAYFAGMSSLTFWRFCLYAYSGAFIWVITFIGLGWKLSDKWNFIEYSLHHYGIRILIISTVVIFIVWLCLKNKKKL